MTGAPAMRSAAVCCALLACACAAVDLRGARPIPQAILRPHDMWEDALLPVGAADDEQVVQAEVADLTDGTWGEVLSQDEEPAHGPSDLDARPLPGALLGFLTIGDWGLPGAQERAVVGAMARAADAYNASFMVSTGDNFYELGVRGEGDPLWEEAFRDVFTAPSLQIPMYVALGNHDHYGSVEAQIAFSRHRRDRRWILPDTNYSRVFTLRDGRTRVQLVVIDTVSLSVDTAVSEAHNKVDSEEALPHHVAARMVHRSSSLRDQRREQLRWLRHTLRSSTADWLFVVGHYPVFSGGEHGSTPELIADVLPLLVDHGVDVYFSGHDHTLQRLHESGIDFVVSGAGSKVGTVEAVPQMVFASVSPGFTVHQLDGERMRTWFVDYMGNVLHCFDRRQQRRHRGKGAGVRGERGVGGGDPPAAGGVGALRDGATAVSVSAS